MYYEGLYVGEDNTNVNQVNGMRQDVVEALNVLKFRYYAGQVVVSPMNIIGKMELVLKKSVRIWFTLTGAESVRIFTLEHMNSLNYDVS